jgi:hypothetical protein
MNPKNWQGQTWTPTYVHLEFQIHCRLSIDNAADSSPQPMRLPSWHFLWYRRSSLTFVGWLLIERIGNLLQRTSQLEHDLPTGNPIQTCSIGQRISCTSDNKMSVGQWGNLAVEFGRYRGHNRHGKSVLPSTKKKYRAIGFFHWCILGCQVFHHAVIHQKRSRCASLSHGQVVLRGNATYLRCLLSDAWAR